MESNEAQYLFTESELNELIADERAAEREACAQVCEAHAKAYLLIESPIAKAGWSACIDSRDAIRARGQK